MSDETQPVTTLTEDEREQVWQAALTYWRRLPWWPDNEDAEFVEGERDVFLGGEGGRIIAAVERILAARTPTPAERAGGETVGALERLADQAFMTAGTPAGRERVRQDHATVAAALSTGTATEDVGDPNHPEMVDCHGYPLSGRERCGSRTHKPYGTATRDEAAVKAEACEAVAVALEYRAQEAEDGGCFVDAETYHDAARIARAAALAEQLEGGAS